MLVFIPHYNLADTQIREKSYQALRVIVLIGYLPTNMLQPYNTIPVTVDAINTYTMMFLIMLFMTWLIVTLYLA